MKKLILAIAIIFIASPAFSQGDSVKDEDLLSLMDILNSKINTLEKKVNAGNVKFEKKISVVMLQLDSLSQNTDSRFAETSTNLKGLVSKQENLASNIANLEETTTVKFADLQTDKVSKKTMGTLWFIAVSALILATLAFVRALLLRRKRFVAPVSTTDTPHNHYNTDSRRSSFD